VIDLFDARVPISSQLLWPAGKESDTNPSREQKNATAFANRIG